MPSTYSSNLKIELQANGENAATWGDKTNTNLGTALEQAIVGYATANFTSDANLTLPYTDTSTSQVARALVLNVTSAVSLTVTRELIVPTIQKQYIVQNNTTGSQSITVKTSAGSGVTIPSGRKMHVYVDGTNVIQMFDFVTTLSMTNLSYTGTLTGGTGIVNLGSGQFYKDASGNVGIGTASPAHRLDVAYDANANSSIRVANSNLGTSATATLRLETQGGTWTINNGRNGGFLSFSDGGGERARFDNAGNLGIGTASPSARLHVVGNQYRQNDSTGSFGFVVNTTAATTRLETLFGGSSFAIRTNGDATDKLLLDSSGNLGIGINNPAAARLIAAYNNPVSVPAAGASGHGFAVGTVGYGIAAGALTSGNSYLQVTRWDGTATNYDLLLQPNGGNVGIGTSSPATRLDVTGAFGTSTTAFTIYNSTAASASNIARIDFRTINTFGGNERVAAVWGINPNAAANNGGALVFGVSANGTATTPSEVARFDQAGNLGIGTASPGAKLDVAGTVRSNNALAFEMTGSAALRQTASGGSMYFDVGAGGSHGEFIWRSSSSLNERMRLDTSGNLGIGTASPQFRLDVQTAGGRVQLRDGASTGGTSSGNGIASVNTALNAIVDMNYRAAVHAFISNNTETMRLDSSGNLGIGTASPAYKLDVRGVTASGNGTITTGFSWDTRGLVGTFSNHALGFITNGTAPSMLLDTSGNLGIGTASPGARLHVAGESRFGLGAEAVRAAIGSAFAAGQGELFTTSTNSMGVGTAGAANLNFYSNSVLRMIIDSNGNVRTNTGALTTTATDGFLYVPTCAGTPTGTPTPITGMAPIVVNTTNNKLYFYSGGAWRDAGP